MRRSSSSWRSSSGGSETTSARCFGAFLVLGVFLEVPQYLPSLSLYQLEEWRLQVIADRRADPGLPLVAAQGAISPSAGASSRSVRWPAAVEAETPLPAPVKVVPPLQGLEIAPDAPAPPAAAELQPPRAAARAEPAIVVRNRRAQFRWREGCRSAVSFEVPAGQGHRPDRPQWRRQVDGAEVDRRGAQAQRPDRSWSTASTSPAGPPRQRGTRGRDPNVPAHK